MKTQPQARPAGTDFLRYLVQSRTDPEVEYLVDLGEYGGLGFCSCLDHQFRKQPYLDRGQAPPTSPYCWHIRVARDQFLKDVLPRFVREREKVPARESREWKGIAAISDRRTEDLKRYLKIKAAFLKANPRCAVYPGLESEDVHHVKGRAGELLFDTRYFLAVSRKAHNRIHQDPQWAYDNGYLLRGWNHVETTTTNS